MSKVLTSLQKLRGDFELVSLLSNSAKILGGRVTTALLNIIAVTVAARFLSASDFGILALTSNLIFFVVELAALNSWQALIAFGSAKLSDPGVIGRFVKLSATFDLVAHILVLVIGLIALYSGLSIFDVPDEIRDHLWLVFLPLVAHAVDDTAKGILRLYNKFALIAFASAINAAFVVVGTLVCAVLDLELKHFIIVYCLAPCIPAFMILVSSLIVASRNGIFARLPKNELADPLPVWRFLRYLIFTNLNSNLSLVSRRADLFIVGALGGAAAAGVFRIVKLVASIPQLAQGPLFMAVFPQFGRLVASREKRKILRLSLQISLMVGAATVAYLVVFAGFGAFALETFYGSEFVAAFWPSIWYLLGLVVVVFGLAPKPVILSYERADLALYSNLAATILFVITLVVLYPILGLVAGGVAFLLHSAIWSTTHAYFANRLMNSRN